MENTEVRLTSLGEAAAISATAGGRRTDRPTLALVSESRWLTEMPVLESGALAEGRLVAAGPGRATLDVSAFGGTPARITVEVLPSQPTVLSAAPAGDTIVLRGYRLRAIGAVVVGSDAAARIAADSATLRIVVPPLAASACSAARRNDPITASGGSVAPGLRVERRHAGELRLQVGERTRLTAEQSRCLRLGAIPEAAYALAFLDVRTIRGAVGAPEPVSQSASLYSVSIAEAGQAAPGASAGAPRMNAAPDHLARSASTSGSPASRTSPWKPGERFDVADPAFGGSVPARVVRVYGGHLVLAVAEDLEPAGGAAAWLAAADSAFAAFTRHGYPLYRTALSQSLPVTSPGSGQLLVIARPLTDGSLGTTVTVPTGSQRLHYVLLNAGQPATANGLLKVLAHELAHTWQERWAAEVRPAGAVGIGAPAWAVEGNADLLAAAVLRRQMGVGLSSNWNWSQALASRSSAPLAVLAAAGRGELTAGYASSASFQRDLVVRLMAAGMGEDAAFAEVSRGVLEGWYGWDRAGGRHAGLTARMARGTGAAWQPGDGLLLWALSQAADDLTGSGELQNPTFSGISTAGASAALGWLPAVALRTAGTAVRTDPAAGATVAGNAATVTRRYGSPGFVRIEDSGRGGVYQLSARGSDDVAWALVRVR